MLSAAEDDILRTFPEAKVSWDTRTSPYMVSVAINGALVRAFIEPDVLVERGTLYDAFTRRVAELAVDSISKARQAH